MGGERETKIVSKSGGTATIGTGAQTIRVHESAGKVHFHDDKKKLKVEAPTAKVWAAWDELKRGKIKDWEFEDIERGTKVKMSESSLVDDTREIAIEVNTAKKHGPNFVAFEKFVNP
jgi:hypothetical protein